MQHFNHKFTKYNLMLILARSSRLISLRKVLVFSQALVQCKYNSSSLKNDKPATKNNLDAYHYEFITKEELESISHTNSALPFEKRRNSDIFGQVVKSEVLKKEDQLVDNFENSVKSLNIDDPMNISPFRKEDGTFIKGNNSEEARLHDDTLKGRVDHSVCKLPFEIAKTINNNILRLASPSRLREKAALIYQSLSKEQIEKAPETPLECDAHIAALFLQDYSHIRQVILELKQRVGDGFSPKRILDIGYGPGTGMIALNEIMGDDFLPEEKDIYVVGRNNYEMKKRAKIILSRQVNENLDVIENEISDEKEEASVSVDNTALEQEIAEEEDSEYEHEYVGPVRTSDINIRSKLRDSLPVTKRYDLIIVNKALLTREHNFPRDIDINIHMILRLLSPGGNLILIQRGNALGFETISRARQIMIRPESHELEVGKIPRPYIKGSSLKPQRLRKEDQLISEEDIEYEEGLLAKYDIEEANQSAVEEGLSFEKELNSKYGEANEDELKFEFEDSEEYEIVPETDKESEKILEDTDVLNSESVNYHISILAPCAHHSKCPLQLGDPKYYKISSHKHRLNFCSFSKVVERPKFTMELKKGKRLATQWDKSFDDGFGIGSLTKNKLNSLQGKGRPGGRNTESGSYSYLIAQRSANDVATIKKIEEAREYNSSETLNDKNISTWPRIIDNPTKIKNNVKLNVCAPSGHIETWQIPKSLGKQEYHDARKVERGDLWGLGKKSVIRKNMLSEKVKEKLDVLSKTQKKSFLKEQRKKQWKKKVSSSEDDFAEDIVTLADSLATSLESSKKYKRQGKRAKYDVDPSSYDGK